MPSAAAVFSPTSSTASSYIRVTSESDHSDDEIVYNVDSLSDEGSTGLASDDDFVVLSRPASPKPAFQGPVQVVAVDEPAHVLTSLTLDLDGLSLGASHEERTAAAEGGEQQTGSAPLRSSTKSKKVKTPTGAAKDDQGKIATKTKAARRRARRAKKKNNKKTAAAAAAAVAKQSLPEVESGQSPAVNKETYDEAVRYITEFITNPEAKEHSACRLALLQALIIELGLNTTTLPTTLTAAKGYLKTHAFVNIREYLAVRGKGLEGLKKIMHPSRNALAKSIKKNRNPASLQWVKDTGLNVLLIHAFR